MNDEKKWDEKDWIDSRDLEALSGRDVDWSRCEPTGAPPQRPHVDITARSHPVINVHAHLINFRFIPDSFNLRVLLENLRDFKVEITKDLIRILKVPATMIGSLIGINWLYEFIKLLDLDNIDEQAAQYRREMDEARISCSAILMMDLEQASAKEGKVPYEDQVLFIYRAVNLPENKDRMLPFIMFDPRRELDPAWRDKVPDIPMEDFVDFCKYAVEVLGFVGIKIYPQLGYHPSEEDQTTNSGIVRRRLQKLYEWCDEQEANGRAVPIVTHSSQGGAWVIDPDIQKEVGSPGAWEGVLQKHPNLTLNLAHFGGDWYDDQEKEGTRRQWRQLIREFISKYPNVYTDMSCNEAALTDKNQAGYFNELKDDLADPKLQNKILFGTDWPMFYHSWTEPQFTEPFVRNLSEAEFRKLACDNPRRFLGDRLPPRWLQDQPA